MAKKRIGLSNTLSRNREELPKKVALKAPSKDLDKVQEKVEDIHTPAPVPVRIATPSPKVEKAVKAEPKKRGRPKTKDADEVTVRLTFDVPKPLHKKLKLKAVMEDKSIRDILLAMIEKAVK